MRPEDKNEKSGMVLVAVVCFAGLAAVLAAGLLAESMTQVRLARRQTAVEQAFYAAEGGAEISVAYIRNGGDVPGLVTGRVGNARFQALVVAAGVDMHEVGGAININPNNSPDNSFVLVKPDGTTITRDDLHNDNSSYDSDPCVYYEGPAVLIRVKPKGNGNQNSLVVDGVPYPLVNANTYDLLSRGMMVRVYNDGRNNGNGRANGKWWVGNITGDDVMISSSADTALGIERYRIVSNGTFEDAERMVVLDGVYQQSWARYALWYNHSGGAIWIRDGEVFDGPVHANTQVYLQGDPIFNALLSSTAASWGPGSSLANVSFNMGYELNAPVQSMASVNFDTLRTVASLVVTGATSITFAQTNMLITNAERGWSNHAVAVPDDGVVYVRSDGSDHGTARVGGVLDGRVTLVTDRSVLVTNHVTYATHPTNGSDNALGLIAAHNVVVMNEAPNNLNIFAHIISCNSATSYSAGFYVQNYDTRAGSGNLNVYGGIVQRNRGAVGLVSGNGFIKNYVYDQRFATAPPPHYPKLTDDYAWEGWRDKL